ncbi:hypothetical protein Sbal183_1909 [Shewanella baltica OS183]|uniref:hypothetical protein n=1 Tax=Shewanella baltica TaxID=62322 RepID=UPI0001E10C0F|nr:hypothetical protein [Shewanella baltica]AEG11644.1 hypothetical protein Sbal175_2393 [Shewanella baltica BA175]EHQ14821.1 hypothetical protein Sbal183_1909 [Shewanella baltica OS183]
MNNPMAIARTSKISFPSVEARQESDPEMRRLFNRYFCGQQEDDNPISTRDRLTAKALLSRDGGVYRLGAAEVIRQGEQLCYRLLNGPMMGLVIQASYQPRGIQLQLFPKTARQSELLARLLPKLNEQLQGRRFAIHLDLMPTNTAETR